MEKKPYVIIINAKGRMPMFFVQSEPKLDSEYNFFVDVCENPNEAKVFEEEWQFDKIKKAKLDYENMRKFYL